MITLYGIANCDSIKKTRQWLDSHDVRYEFHDFRKQGLEESLVQAFLAAIPLEDLINKRGTTWRQVSTDIKNSFSIETALPLLTAQPTLIRRPLLRSHRVFITGYDERQLQQLIENQ
jgi:Spx/MgsR family transcriptional regulator